MNFRIYSTLPGRLLMQVCLAVPLSGLTAAVLAQTAAQTVKPEAPADAGTRIATPPAFRSAFEGYQPYTDEKMVDWKQANDRVGEIGGWREYAREASQPDPVGSSSSGNAGARAAQPGANATGNPPKTGSTRP